MNNMKIHIPTTQYGFIEAEVNNAEEAKDLHDEVVSEFKETYSTGLSATDWRIALDRYLADGTGETETYMNMSTEQKYVIQEIKKAYKRIGTIEDKD